MQNAKGKGVTKKNDVAFSLMSSTIARIKVTSQGFFFRRIAGSETRSQVDISVRQK